MTTSSDTPPEPADVELTGFARLRDAFLKPSRGQAVVAVLLTLLAFATVTQVRIAGQDGAYGNLRQSELIQALNGLQAASRKTERDLSQLQETRDRLQSTSQRREAALEQARSELNTLGVLAGTVAASGPGIRITVEDPSDQLSLTHLLDAVEELRNAGVEAIEINDRVRVVAQTSFEDAPEGIRVDGVALRAPYVIDAIGRPATLATALDFDGGFIDDVKLYSGTVTIKQSDRIEIKVTRNAPKPRYAEPVTGQ
ncbi:MAG: DUF881 domain-containing protein [Marmoricola sp.]